MTKETLLRAANDLPNEFEMDDLFEKIDFLEKLDERIKEAEETEGIPHEKVKDIVKQW